MQNFRARFTPDAGSQAAAVPEDFNWQVYLSLHEDLRLTGIDCEEAARAHYLNDGLNEGRRYKRLVRVAKSDAVNPRSGVNVLGFINSELGLGVACRKLIQKLEQQGIPHALHELPSSNMTGAYYQTDDVSLYDTNIICCNPDVDFLVLTGEEYVRGKTNIGLWFWELESLPEEWKRAAPIFDEIWVNSRFCEKSLARALPGSRIRYLHPEVTAPDARDPEQSKDHFGFDRQSLVFLFVFDGNSDYFRKNPDGVIRAFKSAFEHERDVILVIKTHNLASQYVEKLEHLVGDDARIRLYLENFSAANINSLMNACDVYVSLHRSEGLGLTILDAILLDKPVICTAWSGNMDFFHDTYSGLVSYEFVAVDDASDYRQFFPRDTVVRWADPDIARAAELMKECREDIAAKKEEISEVKRQLLANFTATNYREVLGASVDLTGPVSG